MLKKTVLVTPKTLHLTPSSWWPSSVRNWTMARVLRMIQLRATGFQPGQGETPGLNAIQAFSSPASHSLVPLPGTSPIHTMHNLDAVASDGANSESAPDSETTGPTTHKQKHKSKAMIVYKKLAFNKCQATDRQCTKGQPWPDVNVAPEFASDMLPLPPPSMVHCSA